MGEIAMSNKNMKVRIEKGKIIRGRTGIGEMGRGE